MTSTSHDSTSNPISNTNPQRISSLKTFLASDEPIQIIPIFNYNRSISELLLTQTNIQPFTAGQITTVPLWIAIYLRKRNLCRLISPKWLSVPILKRILHHERNPNEESFSMELPFRYMEISRVLIQTIGATRSAIHAAGGSGGSVTVSELGSGSEEIPQVDIIRVLLEDISTVRLDKIRRNIHSMSALVMSGSMVRPMPIVNVTGIGAVEMAAVKPFLERAFEDHLKLVRCGTTKSGTGAVSATSNSNSTTTTSSASTNNGVGLRRTTRSRRQQRQEQRQQEQQQLQQQQQQQDENEQDGEFDDDDELMEPTASIDEDENQHENQELGEGGDAAVSKIRVRRYRS